MANEPIFNPNVTTDIKARDTTLIPLAPGQFLMTSDTKCIFYDLEDSRIQLTDIIELNTEAQRQGILAPLNKFYFVKDTGSLWRYNNGEWLEWPAGGGGGGGGASRSVEYVMTVAGWGDSTQYEIPIEGLTATQNGIVGLSQNVSQAEREAAAGADMYVSGQKAGSFTMTRAGEKPTRDIPLTIILFE